MSPMHISACRSSIFNVAQDTVHWSAPNRSLKTVVYGLGRLKYRACRRSIIFNYGQEIISVAYRSYHGQRPMQFKNSGVWARKAQTPRLSTFNFFFLIMT